MSWSEPESDGVQAELQYDTEEAAITELAAENILPWTKERIKDEITAFKNKMTETMLEEVDEAHLYNGQQHAASSAHPALDTTTAIINMIQERIAESYEEVTTTLRDDPGMPISTIYEYAREEIEYATKSELYGFGNFLIESMAAITSDMRVGEEVTRSAARLHVRVYELAVSRVIVERFCLCDGDEDRIMEWTWFEEPVRKRMNRKLNARLHRFIELSRTEMKFAAVAWLEGYLLGE